MSSARFPVRWMKSNTLITLCSVITVFALILSACSSSDTNSTTPTPSSSTPAAQGPGAYGLAALPGYSVSLFASQAGTTSQASTSFFSPDSLVVDNGFVYIDYQNNTAKDCTDKNTSTVVQYDMNGKMQKSLS